MRRYKLGIIYYLHREISSKTFALLLLTPRRYLCPAISQLFFRIVDIHEPAFPGRRSIIDKRQEGKAVRDDNRNVWNYRRLPQTAQMERRADQKEVGGPIARTPLLC